MQIDAKSNFLWMKRNGGAVLQDARHTNANFPTEDTRASKTMLNDCTDKATNCINFASLK